MMPGGMWHSSGPQGPAPDQEQLQPLIRRSQAPDNEVPVTVPLGLVLARSDDTAVLLPSAEVYRHGVSLDIAAGTRRRGSGRVFSMSMHGPMERGAGAFLLRVGLSDGRRASTLHRRPPFDALGKGVMTGGREMPCDRRRWVSRRRDRRGCGQVLVAGSRLVLVPVRSSDRSHSWRARLESRAFSGGLATAG